MNDWRSDQHRSGGPATHINRNLGIPNKSIDAIALRSIAI
jgi:hypothetical protein